MNPARKDLRKDFVNYLPLVCPWVSTQDTLFNASLIRHYVGILRRIFISRTWEGVSRAAAGGSAKPIRQRFDDISGYREIRLIRAASYVDGRSTYIPDEADSRLLPHCLGPLQLLAPMVYSSSLLTLLRVLPPSLPLKAGP